MGLFSKTFGSSKVVVKTGSNASKGSSGRNKFDVYSGTKGSSRHDHYWVSSSGKPGAKIRSSFRLDNGKK